jgi:hypothetical protein
MPQHAIMREQQRNTPGFVLKAASGGKLPNLSQLRGPLVGSRRACLVAAFPRPPICPSSPATTRPVASQIPHSLTACLAATPCRGSAQRDDCRTAPVLTNRRQFGWAHFRNRLLIMETTLTRLLAESRNRERACGSYPPFARSSPVTTPLLHAMPSTARPISHHENRRGRRRLVP